jgi:CHAD domain-containing protein
MMPRSLEQPTRPIHCVRDAALDLLDGAIQALRDGMDDRAIHEARKTCKRIRAALRLLRDSLGKAVYERENRALREVARPLTAIRDAFVLRQTLGELPPHSATLDLRLAKDYQRARLRLERGGTSVALGRLSQVRSRLSEQRVGAPELLSAAAGVGSSYRAGGKALRKARSRDDAALHEWRKQTKYLLNQLELLKSVFKVNFKKFRHQADDLAGALGDDHDLSVLVAKLGRYKECDRALVKEMKARRRKLQARALRIGGKLYRHSAKHVQLKTARKLIALGAGA